MTGQTVSSRPRFPLFTVLFLATAVALVAAALARNDPRYAAGSLPLWLLAAALHLTRPRPVSVTFTDTAIEVAEPPESVPYSDLEGLLAGGRAVDPFRKGARRFPVQLFHTGGVLEIPARLDVPSDEVYRYLFHRIPARSTRPVHPDLAGHLRQKQKEFGDNRVWSFAARSRATRPSSGRRAGAVCAALVASGLGWVAYGNLTSDGVAWWGPGILLCASSALFGLIAWLASWQRAAAARVKGGRASLVIAPDGLAVLQGDLRGELRWDELLGVKLNPKPQSFHWGSEASIVPGILLKVAGASILLTDVYDRPLPLIYYQLSQCVRGSPEQEGFDPVVLPRPASADRGRFTTDRDDVTAGPD